jgi:outer membrane lipoprotein-sorting protein
MKLKKYLPLVLAGLVCSAWVNAQTAEALIKQVRAKLDRVNDYEASAQMKTNVAFIKAPVTPVKIYFKKPNKLRIKNETGLSFIPKGSVNMNLNTIFAKGDASYDVIDVGKEAVTNLRIIKLLPKDDNAEVVLSTLYIDEKTALIKKSKTTTKDNGTYELEMIYGKYSEYGLADKVIFSFNTKEYKLPKGVAYDYDDGTKKNETDKQKEAKGKVEISYTSYTINKGVPDSVFNEP